MPYYTVSDAVQDLGFDRQTIIGIFQTLQKRGMGKFVVGRRGWPSRWEPK
ncbi:hypothetical protein [Brevundimonas sp.]|nr:hypothetical protein [Brevundimonas sp.]